MFDSLLHIFRTIENMSHLEDMLGKAVPAGLSQKMSSYVESALAKYVPK